MGEEAMEIQIEALSETFDPNDEKWMKQANSLYTSLTQVGDVRRESEAEEGKKGGPAAIILALGSAGVISGAVQMFRNWLARDRNRSIRLTVTRNGKTESISLSGEGISEAMLRDLLKSGIPE